MWHLQLSPEKSYIKTNKSASFRLTQATLVKEYSDDNYVDLYMVKNTERHLLCMLKRDTIPSYNLNLQIAGGEEVIFFIRGNGLVDLTGDWRTHEAQSSAIHPSLSPIVRQNMFNVTLVRMFEHTRHPHVHKT